MTSKILGILKSKIIRKPFTKLFKFFYGSLSKTPIKLTRYTYWPDYKRSNRFMVVYYVVRRALEIEHGIELGTRVPEILEHIKNPVRTDLELRKHLEVLESVDSVNSMIHVLIEIGDLEDTFIGSFKTYLHYKDWCKKVQAPLQRTLIS